MYEKASRYDVLAKEFCRCPRCGAGFPNISITSVERKSHGHIRKKYYYRIKCVCTHSEYHSYRDFEVEVPDFQYWRALERYGIK